MRHSARAPALGIFWITVLVMSIMPTATTTPPTFPSLASTAPAINPPTFNVASINASMGQVLSWAVARILPNGTATLQGTSNNLWSTSLVGRVMTYLDLEIGNATTKTIIQNMTRAEHLLLQNPSYISYGVWAPASANYQLQVHLDAQKFLSRSYGLTLDLTARSDMINITQNIHLNAPTKIDYFDSVAWGLANALWFAYYSRSTLPPTSDFATAVQDLNTNYDTTGARAAASNPSTDFGKLLHYLKTPTYTDSYFKLEGNSLSQAYLDLEIALANQLVNRQMSNGDIATQLPFKAYLVEDYARDLDSTTYLKNNLTYAYSAYRAEYFLTSQYLQSNGNFSLPNAGEGLFPQAATHMLSIANDVRSCSSQAWYSMLTASSKLVNYTLTTQNPDGTFRFFLNITNPGFALTTISSVSALVDSYVVLHNTNVVSPETPVGLLPCTQPAQGSSFLGSITWLLIAIPLVLIIALAIVYESRHRAKYKGMVEK